LLLKSTDYEKPGLAAHARAAMYFGGQAFQTINDCTLKAAPGPYQMQAAFAATYARGRTADRTPGT
jgi:predicted RNA polymerase sigma factor